MTSRSDATPGYVPGAEGPFGRLLSGGVGQPMTRAEMDTQRLLAAQAAQYREATDDLPFAEPESDAPEVLAAWHSGFAYAETYRKVTLAHCRELERAKAAAAETKVSEARLDDLALTNPLYLAYLARQLQGRVKYEAMIREGMGAL